MGKYNQGTTIDLTLETYNRNTGLSIAVSAVSCYIEENNAFFSIAVETVKNGYYLAHWQTTSTTVLGKHKYKFVYRLNGTRVKVGILEVV